VRWRTPCDTCGHSKAAHNPGEIVAGASAGALKRSLWACQAAGCGCEEWLHNGVPDLPGFVVEVARIEPPA
jgi:hypothetical protein